MAFPVTVTLPSGLVMIVIISVIVGVALAPCAHQVHDAPVPCNADKRQAVGGGSAAGGGSALFGSIR